MVVFTLMSMPRPASCRLVYARSLGWNGISSSGAVSTSRICIRAGSTSGKVARSTSLRSSPRVPASSTPVAPPPTTVTANSRLPSGSALSHSKPFMMWSRSTIASARVYRPKVFSAAPLTPK